MPQDTSRSAASRAAGMLSRHVGAGAKSWWATHAMGTGSMEGEAIGYRDVGVGQYQ